MKIPGRGAWTLARRVLGRRRVGLALVLLVVFALGGVGGLAADRLRDGDEDKDELVVLQEIQVRGERAGSATAAAPVVGEELLPDLDQEAPLVLAVSDAGTADGPLFLLGFDSAVANVGSGPLEIEGRRSDRGEPTMSAGQVIAYRDGSSRLLSGAGRLQFVESPDHAHWHFLPFEQYELRRADDFSLVGRDGKTGYCLGDRYESILPSDGPAQAPAVFTSRCGLDEPDLLELREGISVGYGDDYSANLEGQYLDISDVVAGDYVLVHRVNADRALRESDYENNAASLLFALTWVSGKPHVEVLAVCPDSERCSAG
jgi:lysyl oxidase